MLYPELPKGCQQPVDEVKCQDSLNSEAAECNIVSSAMHSSDYGSWHRTFRQEACNAEK